MIDRPDLHPDDLAERVRMRDQLRQERQDRKLSGRALSELAGWNGWAVEDLETKTNWGLRRVMPWARILDHRLRMTITGLTLPDDDDLLAEMLAVAVPFGGLDEDTLHVRAVVNDLARIRAAQGISAREFALRVQAGDKAVRGWEDKPTHCLVKTVQRYARGLGGALNLALEPVTTAVAV